MVYLDNQEQVRQAFSQVAHAVHYVVTLKTRNGIKSILGELAKGMSREESFRSVLNFNPREFEAEWREFLKKEDLKESPGASPDKLKIGPGSDELEEFTGVDIRGHIRLGDRLRQGRRSEAARVQYLKALEKEPSNPVALTKLARTYLSLGKKKEAAENLEKCSEENPNYVPAFLLLGEHWVQEGNWAKGLWYYQESNAINPFNPAVHKNLSELYGRLGEKEKSIQEAEVLNFLTEGN